MLYLGEIRKAKHGLNVENVKKIMIEEFPKFNITISPDDAINKIFYQNAENFLQNNFN